MQMEPFIMQIRACSYPLVVFVLFGALISLPFAHAADSSKMKTIAPEELVRILNAMEPKPLLFQVGSHQLFLQAHIPASEYLGAASTSEGIEHLRRRASPLPKNTPVVLYCGCCPWSHCPNVNPAYDALQQMGFTNVKVLFIANNFGTDWVDKGYPVANGD